MFFQRSSSNSFLLFLFLASTLTVTRAVSAAPLIPTDVTVITAKDLNGQAFFSVGDALAGLTSLKMERDGYKGTRALAKMRGLTSAKAVVVMIDGRPLSHEFDSEVDLNQIPISLVERIEVTRGGASVSNSGEAIGGSINVITNRPKQKGVDALLGLNVSRYGAKFVKGQITGRSNLGDVTYHGDNEESSGFMENEDFKASNHFFNYTRSFNGKGYWGAEYLYHNSRVGLSNGTQIPYEEWNGRLEKAPSTPHPERTEELQHVKGFLASPPVLGGVASATLTKSFRDFDDRETHGGISIHDQNSDAEELELTWKSKVIEMGFESRELRRKIYQEPVHKVFENDGFLLAKIASEKWSVIPGVRLDHHSRSGSYFVPRIAGVFAPHKAWQFSSTAQAAHRTPTFDELFVSSTVINNPDLSDEKSRSYDAGIAWMPSPSVTLKVTGFSVRMDDLITPDPHTSILQNGGTEKSKGLESEASIQGETIGLSANWTIQESRRQLPSASKFSASAMTPRHLVFSRLRMNLNPSIAWINEIRYQSSQYENDDQQGLLIPAFYTWNMRVVIKILTAHLYVEANNITARRYAETYALGPSVSGADDAVLAPQPARTFGTGITIRFLN